MFKLFIFVAVAIAAVQAKYPGEEEVLKELSANIKYSKFVIEKLSEGSTKLVEDQAKAAQKRGGAKSYSCAKMAGEAYISKLNGVLFADFGAIGYYCLTNKQKIKEGKLSLEEFNEVVSTLDTYKKTAEKTISRGILQMGEYTNEYVKTAKSC